MAEKPSWVGKKVEDMTDEEKKEYERYIERFVWKPGDLEYVGHEPLTEEQKKLVEQLKKEEEEE